MVLHDKPLSQTVTPVISKHPGFRMSDQLKTWIEQAKNIIVLTGAGISAESGIPTFRDALEGLWSNYSPEELATPEAWQRQPELVSKWYEDRREKVLACEPNPGHEAIANFQIWAEHAGKRVTVLTQNVDGLHFRAAEKAGANTADIIEVHGSLLRWRCTKTQKETLDLPSPFPQHLLPSADGGFLRPAVVWFGEFLPEAALKRAAEELSHADLFISIGTSGNVYPVAGWLFDAKRAGAKAVEVNRDPSQFSSEFDISLRGRAGELLPSLLPHN